MQVYKSIALAGAGFTVGVLLLFAAGGFDPDFLTTVMLIVLNGAIVSYPIAKVISGRFPWYSPNSFALAALTLFYVVAPAVVLIFPQKSEYYDRYLSPEEFERAMLWAVVGVSSYLVGFKFGPKRTYFNRPLEWYFAETPSVRNVQNMAALGLWTMGMLAWAYMFFVVGGGRLQEFGTERGNLIGGAGGTIYHIAKFAYVGSLLYFARNGLNLMSAAMILSFAFFLLVFGSRSFVAILLLGAVIIYRYRFTRKIPLVMWVGVAAGLVLLMGFLAVLRATKNVGQAVEAYSQTTSTTEGKIMSVIGFMDFVIPMAEVINNTGPGNRIPYENGKTLGQILYFIPSFLWKGQYMFQSASQVYTSTLFPQKAGQVTLTPSLVAEFYINRGGVGVVVGMFGMGFYLRWLHSRLLADPRRQFQLAWIVFSALITVNMVRVFKNGFGTLVFMFYFFVPLVAAYSPNLKLFFNPPKGKLPPVLDENGENIEDDALLFGDDAGYLSGFEEYAEYESSDDDEQHEGHHA